MASIVAAADAVADAVALHCSAGQQVGSKRQEPRHRGNGQCVRDH